MGLLSFDHRIDAFGRNVHLGLGDRNREEFPWKKYKTFIDIGGAQGYVRVEVAFAHPHLSGAEFDLSRLTFTPGGFFKDPLPSSDVLIMGHILHDWNLD